MKIAILIIAIILMFVSNSFARGASGTSGHSGHSRGHSVSTRARSHVAPKSTKKFILFKSSKFRIRKNG